MGYLYRYTDLVDDIIKYVGIVWSDNRTLVQRLSEHEKNDDWCYKRKWKIEYITADINSRTDAEYFESHYISLYETDKYFNIKKSGWGVSAFLPDRESEWKEYKIYFDDEFIKFKEEKEKIQTEIEKLKNSSEELKKELQNLYTTKNIELQNKNKTVNIDIQDIIDAIDRQIVVYDDYTYGTL